MPELPDADEPPKKPETPQKKNDDDDDDPVASPQDVGGPGKTGH